MRSSVRYFSGALFLILAVLLYLSADSVRRSWVNQGSSWWREPSAHHETKESRPVPEVKTRTAGEAVHATSSAVANLLVSSPTRAAITLSTGNPSKIIVMAKMESENTDWVAEELPDWQRAIYTVNNPNATLHTSRNKGREANVYLTYIIDHYDDLPDIIVFLHAHRNGSDIAWHNDDPNFDNVNALRSLRIAHVQERGYANLRCQHVPGCPDTIHPLEAPRPGARIPEHAIADAWQYMFPGVEVPQVIGVACCSQFAVSENQLLKRSKGDYERYMQWLMETKLEDAISGRVLEYLWHVIFGMEAVNCPPIDQCYCETFGRQC